MQGAFLLIIEESTGVWTQEILSVEDNFDILKYGLAYDLVRF